MPNRPRLTDIPLTAGVALVYFAAAKLGLALATINASASPVWPPTGIAIAGALVLGPRVFPGVWLGAFAANLTTAGGVATSAAIATGNLGEAFVALLLVRRFAAGERAFESAAHTFRFAAIAFFAAAPVSATVGVATLVAAGLAPATSAPDIWTTWWLGDATGALAVTPAIVLWWRASPRRPSRRRLAESGVLAATTLVVSLGVFLQVGVPSEVRNLLRGFLALPLVVWGAYRFGPRGAASVTLAIAAIAAWGAAQGLGPYASEDPNDSLLVLQTYVAVLTLVALPLAATVQEREMRLGRTESRFSGFMEHLPGLAWIKDARGRYVFANDAFAQTLGRRSADIAGKTDADLFPPEVATEYAANDAKVQRSGHVLRTVEHQPVRGELRSSVVSKFPIPDEEGRLVGGVAIDVTERVRAEERFRHLVEAAPDGIIIVDAVGCIVLANRQAETLFGYEEAELLGKPVETLVPARFQGNHPTHRAAYAQAPRTRPMGAGLTLSGRRKDGTEFPVEISLSPISTTEGPQVMSTIRDVTEKLRSQRIEREQVVTRKLVRRMLRHAAMGEAAPPVRRALGREMAEEAAGADIDACLQSFETMGLGTLQRSGGDVDRYAFRGTGLIEVTPGRGMGTCHLALGFLEGCMRRVAGRAVLGTETTCQSMGHEACTFTVLAKGPPDNTLK